MAVLLSFALAVASVIGVQVAAAPAAQAAAWKQDKPGIDTVGASVDASPASRGSVTKSTAQGTAGTVPSVDLNALYGVDGNSNAPANIAKISTSDAKRTQQFGFTSVPVREQTMLAVDSGKGEGQEGFYMWYRGTQGVGWVDDQHMPLWYVAPGAKAPTKVYSVPDLKYFGYTDPLGASWSTGGGTVDQKTGRVYLKGGRNEYLGPDGNVRLSVFDPKTLQTYWSGKLQPATASDDLWRHSPTAGFTTPGYVSCGLALTASGDYVLVVKGTDVAIPANSPINTTGKAIAAGSVDVSFMVRVHPSFSSEPWTYSVMKMITRDPSDKSSAMSTLNETQLGMAFSGGKLYLEVMMHLVEIDPGTGYWKYVGEVNSAPITNDNPAPQNAFFMSFASAQTAVAINGTVRDDAAATGIYSASAPGVSGITMALYQKDGSAQPKLVGTTVTDGSGKYLFVIPKTATDGSVKYYVRPVQPKISGKKARITAGSVVSTTALGLENTVNMVCGDGTTLSGGAIGARLAGTCPGGADPALESIGASVDPASFGAYGVATMRSVWADVETDFAITAQQAVDPSKSTLVVTPAGPLPVGTNAGSTYTATITAKDADGDLVAGGKVAVSVTLPDGSAVGAGTALSADECTTGTDGKCSVTLTSTKAGSYKISAKVPARDGSGPADINGSPATRAYTAGPLCVTEAGCVPESGAPHTRVQVTTDNQTADGVAADVVTAWAYDKYGNPLGGQKFDFTAADSALKPGTASCTTNATATDPAFGTCTVGEKSTVATTYSLAAAVASTQLTSNGSPLTLTFVNGAADPAASRLTVKVTAAGATTVAADGVASWTATVRAVDANGNAVSGEEVTFTVGDPVLKLSDGGTCTTGSAGTCSVTVTSTKAGTFDVRALLPDLASGVLTDVGGSPASVKFVAGPVCVVEAGCVPDAGVATTKVVVSTDGQLADGVAADVVTASAFDKHGNPVAGVSFDFATAVSVLRPGGASCVTGVDGTCTVSQTSTVAGTHELTAAVGGSQLSETGSPLALTFVHGVVDLARSSLTVSASQASAITGSVDAIATIQDASGNPIAGETVTFAVTGAAKVAPATCVTGADGKCSSPVTDTKAEKVKVSATVSVSGVAGALSGSPRDVTFMASVVDPARSSFAVRPTVAGAARVVADGVDSWTGVLTARDSADNPVPGLANVVFAASSGEVALTAVVDHGDGTYTVRFVSKKAGAYTATVEAGGAQIGSALGIPFVAGPVVPAKSVLSVSAHTAAAGGSVTATVTAYDAEDNLVSDATFDLSVGKPGGGSVSAVIGGASATTCATSAAGTCSVQVSDEVAESVDVIAVFGGVAVKDSPQNVVFTVSDVDYAASSFVVAATSGAAKVVADGTDSWTGTLRLVDDSKAHNPVSGVALERIVIMVSSAEVKVTGVEDNGDGTYTVRFTSTRASEAYTAAAMVDENAIPATRAIPFVAGPADPGASTSVLSVAPAKVTVGGTATATVTVTDKFGNPVGGARVDFGLTGSAKLAAASCVTDKGSCQVTLTDEVAETVQVSAVIGGAKLSNSPQSVEFTADAFDPSKSMFDVEPTRVGATRVVADGMESWTATLTARDGHNNLLKNLDPQKVEFVAGSPVKTGPVVNNGDGTYSAVLTSVKADRFDVSAAYDQATTTDSPKQIVFVAGAPDPDHSMLQVSPTSATVGDTVTATVTIRDANDNPVSDYTVPVAVDKNATITGACVTNAAGVCSVTLTDKKAETVDVTAKIDGSDIVGSPTTVTFGYGAIDPRASRLEAIPDRQTVGSNVTVRVTVKDVFGLGIPDLPASAFVVTGVATDPAGLPDLVLNSFSDLGDGVYTYLTTSTKAGVFGLGATVSGTVLDDRPSVTFVAGEVCVSNCVTTDPAATTRFEVTIDGQLADGKSADVVTAYAFDTYGNPVEDAAVRVTDETGAPLVGLLSPAVATAKTGADGSVALEFVTVHDGKYQVEGMIDALRPATGVRTLSFVPGNVDPSKSTLTVTPASAEVGTSVTAKAVTRDAQGNLVGGVQVSFGSDSDDVLFSASAPTATCETAKAGPGLGACELPLTSKIAGEYEITAQIGSAPIGGSPAPVEFTVGSVCFENCDPVDAKHVTRVLVTKDGAVDDDSDFDVVTAYAYDRYGNPVAGAKVATTAITSSLHVRVNNVTTGADGAAQVTYTSAKKGPADASVVIDGVEPKNPDGPSPVTMSFAGGKADPRHSFVTIDPTTSRPVDSVFTITATVNDASDQPVEGAVVSFAGPAGLTFLQATSCVTGADGACQAQVTSTKVGTYAVAATIPEGTLAGSPVTARFTAGPVCVAPQCVADPGEPKSRVELTTDGQPNDGVARDVATVWAFDVHGNPVAGAVVASTSDDADLSVQPSIAVTGANGQTTIWYSSLVAGSHDADVTVDGLTPAGSPLTMTFGNGIGSAKHSGFEVAPAVSGASVPLTVGTTDESTYRVTATVRDAFDKPAAGAIVSFAINPAGATWTDGVRSCTTGADGTCSVRVHSTTAGPFAVTAALGADPIGSAKPATWKAGAVCVPGDPCTQVDPDVPAERRSRVEVTRDNQVADGFQLDVVTVHAFDAYGNPVPGALVHSTKADAADALSVQSAVDGTDDQGVTTISYASTVAGPHQADVTVDGKVPAGSPVTVRFVPGAPDAGKSTLRVSATAVKTGETVTATVTARDAHGNLVGGTPITVTSDGHSVMTPASPTSCVTNNTWSDPEYGTCKTTFTDGEVETVVVAATIGGTRAAQHIDGSTADVRFLRDAPPAAPEITSPADGDLTKDADVTVTGTGEPGATVTVTDNGGSGCTATVAADGTWSCQVSLEDGDHTLVASQTDPEGNQSGDSDPVEITVDTTAPKPPVVTGPKDGELTKDPTPEVTGTGDPGDEIKVTDEDGNQLCTATVRPDGTWSCTPDKELEDGEHTLVVTETDPAGNESDPTEVPLVVDTTPPAAPVIERPAQGELVDTARPTFEGTAEEGSTVVVKEGDQVLCTATADEAGKWSCTSEVELPDGSHKVDATATDEAGNVSEPSDDRTFTVDATRPGRPIVTGPKPGDLTNDPTPEITGKGDPGDEITVTDEDGDQLCTATVRPDGTWSCTPGKELEDGDHKIVVVETDPLGRDSDPTEVPLVVDTTAPDAPVIDRPSEGQLVNTPKPTFEGTAEKGATVVVKEGDKVLCEAVADASGNWKCTSKVPLPDGEHTVSATATDGAGNTSDPSDDRSFRVDATPPGKPIVDDTDGSIITGSGDEPGLTVNITDKDGNTIPGCEDVVVGDDHTFWCRPTTPLPPGFEVKVSLTDEAGNTGPSATVTVATPGAVKVPGKRPAVGTGGSVIVGSPLAWVGALLVAGAVVVMVIVARRRKAER